MEQQLPKQRDSNFELLRIFAMFIIILHHLAQHGLWFAPNSPVTSNFLLQQVFFGELGGIGNWLFIFVSGYFISTKSFSWKKVFRMWLQIFSISAIIGIVTWFSKILVVPGWDKNLMDVYTTQGFAVVARPMKLYDLVSSFLPCYRSNNWFATAYITFFLLVPVFDMFVTRLSQQELKRTIILLCILGTIIPLFVGETFYRPSSIFCFILGFLIAKYIRQYGIAFFDNIKRNLLLAFGIFALLIFYKVFCSYLFSFTPVPLNYAKLFANAFNQNTSFPVMLCALCIFCAFRSLRIPHNRVINVIASTTFGVYLIHENLLINKWWWHAVCKLDDWISSPYLIGYMLLCTVVTFAICSVLELVRKYCLEKPLFALLFRK